MKKKKAPSTSKSKEVLKTAVVEEVKAVKGYKIFHPDFTCSPGRVKMQYEENKEFRYVGELRICNKGLHFCTKAQDCFRYYDFDSNNIVCEVEARGKVEFHEEDSKACTDILFVGRRLTWQEVLEVANSGKNNTGHSNTGSSNTGSRNTGDWNTGSRNTGYSNTGDSNTGYFNTSKENPFIPMFNKPSTWTIVDVQNSRALQLMRNNVDTKLWIPEASMTEEEKKQHYGYKTAGGFYRDIPFKEAFSNAWHNWSASYRKAFTDLPNFDAAIFEEITSVKI